VILLAGPTAVGKSEVALRLAERLGGEVLSVDSMQVYRGLDIGTAKPSPADRARVPHHLIDVAGPDEAFDAARFVALARAVLQDLASRQRPAILCGGSGLYFQALLHGLGEAPPADPAVRAELERLPLEQLLAELAKSDPALHERIDRANRRRIERALEVIRLTGRPFSAQRAAWPEQGAASPDRITPLAAVGFTRERGDLTRRCDQRVERMFAQGLVEETRRLLDAGLARNRTAMQAIGYRQVAEHLRGERSLSETVALVKQKTRQYARRQMTWFRHHLDWEWLELQPQEDLPGAADRLAERFRRSVPGVA
jgi:tRNA dimethylallyltransferase